MKIQLLEIALFFLVLCLLGQNSTYAQKGGGNYGVIGVAQPISANNTSAIAIPQSIKSNSRQTSTLNGKITGTRVKYKLAIGKDNKIKSLNLYNRKGIASNAWFRAYDCNGNPLTNWFKGGSTTDDSNNYKVVLCGAQSSVTRVTHRQ